MKLFSTTLALFFCFLITSFNVDAQKSKLDSLYLKLKNERDDTNKAKALATLCINVYYSNNSGKLDSLCKLTIKLADSLHFPLSTIRANWCMGSYNIQQGKSLLALEYFKKGMEVAHKNNNKFWEAILQNSIGLVYMNQNDFREALEYYNNAIDIWEAIKNKLSIMNEATVFNNIGDVYQSLANYESAEKYYLQALKLNEEIKNEDGESTSLNNMGTIYKAQKNYDKAIEYSYKSLKLRQKLNEEFESANSMGNIADIYSCMHKYREALTYYYKALEVFQKEKNTSLIALTYLNIGIINTKEGLYTDAALFCDKALQLGNELQDKEFLAEIMISYGEVYIKQEQYNKALNYEIEALSLAKGIGTQDQIMRASQDLSTLYEKLANGSKSLEYYKMYIQTKDSIFNRENVKKMVETEMNYDFDKKQAIEKAEQDKKEQVHEEQVKKQKIVIYSVLLGFILLLLLAITIYRSLQQNKKKTRVIVEQKEIIEENNRNIVDSISYAKVIQQAILPSDQVLKEQLPKSFILYKPKDIVSGDFYWYTHVGDLLIIAAIDCTGHGVPGAFMSMIGNTLINEIVNAKHITKPSEILKHLNTEVYKSLHQNEQDIQLHDGMDISLCVIDKKKKQIEYAGAKNPLYVVRENKSIEVIKANPYNIGGGLTTKKTKPLDREYTNHVVSFEQGVKIYLFSDGYMDQLGINNRKFGSEKFMNLLLSIQELDMEEQKLSINNVFENWRGDKQQIDDVLVIGIELA